MTRAWSLFLMLFLLFPGLMVFAQEETAPDERPVAPPIDSDWGDYALNVYNKGDKMFNMTLGLMIPTVFSGIDDEGHGLKVGGTLSLAFSYFLTSHFFLGGELSGMFSGTRGKNMLFIVPFGLRLGYQFVFRRFEFPLTLMIGAAPQKYIEEGYFGFFMKPSASVFWRFRPDWSFGLNGMWWFLPQWPKDGHNTIGNFLEVSLTARYHF